MSMLRNTHKLLLLILVLSFVFLLHGNCFGDTTSPDAIGIREIPNPNHFSPLRWYKENIKAGAPQSIQVDGYEAVRDGRSVYVNAANITNGRLYTNINLLSYNQKPEAATQDIFAQLFSHWKFNTNLTDTGDCSQPQQRLSGRLWMHGP